MLERLVGLIEGAPRVIRPALYGAIALCLIVAARGVFILPSLISRPERLRLFGQVLLLATAAGAVGGLGYSLIGAPSRRIPVIGPYVAGIVTVGCYLAAALFALLRITDDPQFRGPIMIMSFAVTTLIFGVLFGYHAFRDSD